MDYLSVAVNLFGFRYMDDMTWNQPYVPHVIHCHSGLKSQGTE